MSGECVHYDGNVQGTVDVQEAGHGPLCRPSLGAECSKPPASRTDDGNGAVLAVRSTLRIMAYVKGWPLD